MKILVLNYEYPPLGGGAAPVSRDIAAQLKAHGHRVTLLTMGFKDLPEYEVENGVEIYRLKCIRKRSDACQPWEQLSYLLAVRKFMKRHPELQEYDVCHTHFVIPTGEVAYYISRKYNIPYIITAHGSDVEGHNKKKSMIVMHRILRNSWKRIVNNSCCVVSPSIYLKKLMERNNSKGNYVMIPNGIEVQKYKELNDIEDKKKKILVMGRLQKFKNVQTILEAISKIDMGDWKVEVIGDGPYRQQLEELAETLGIANVVEFHGWIRNNSQEQFEFLKEASIYVSASQFENCPMSVIEATLSGCYPILSDIPAHRQLIEEDRFFFDMNDANGLAMILTKRMGMGIVEFRYDLDKYSWNNIIPQYEEILKKAKESYNDAVNI